MNYTQVTDNEMCLSDTHIMRFPPTAYGLAKSSHGNILQNIWLTWESFVSTALLI